MDEDTMDLGEQGECKSPKQGIDKPPAWMSTEQLETELFNGIQDTSSVRDGDMEAYADFDEDLDVEEEYEDEDERRRSTLRALSTVRPELAALLTVKSKK